MRLRLWLDLGLGALSLTALGLKFFDDRIPEELGFHERSCRSHGRAERQVHCGWMVVPENRGRADSRSIALPVAIFRANVKAGAGEPLVFINGGPGYRVGIGHRDEIDSWWDWVDHIPAHRNVIIVGLRGTGLEAPDFNCPSWSIRKSGRVQQYSLAARVRPGPGSPRPRSNVGNVCLRKASI